MSKKNQTEGQLEEKLIDNLVANGYERIKLTDEKGLMDNFRKQINILNKDKEHLNEKELSDDEFDRLTNKILGASTFLSAIHLREKHDIQLDDGSTCWIKLFDVNDWCKNIFQVTNQLSMEDKYKNRYDVNILINGIPVVQIELKKSDVEMTEAFNQIVRYKKETLNKGLLRFLQFFVISNGVDTKYFSNNEELNVKHTFFWANDKNKRIQKLDDIANYMLPRCWVAKLISRYMVLEKATKVIKIMRPYQIYAVEALMNRSETKNNGYVWHTTGSGKTLTSFKLSQLLANDSRITRVIFLVDRKDLDSQTISEFNKFQEGSVDATENTKKLIEQLSIKTIGPSNKLILTTIQKMSIVCKEPKNIALLKRYEDEKVIIIIDECHRTQFGEMHTAVKKKFKSAQWFGFTGTPRLKENKSAEGATTADVFEKCLHTYLIKNAIHDTNVLGFSVDYIKTFNATSDEELAEEKVEAIDTKEVILADKRINNIANHVIDTFNKKTFDGRFNAMFTLNSVDMLIKYYKAFKKLNHNLKISAIFSHDPNEDPRDDRDLAKHELDEIIVDYNKMFDKNYSVSYFSSYFADLSKKFKNKEIDLLLVVDMFLTGFDAPRMNTLFIDRRLKHHNLIQAFSRTNRLFDEYKSFGNIVCYQTTKKRVDEAVKLFSQTDSVDDVLMKELAYYLKRFNNNVDKLKEIYAGYNLIEIGDGSLDEHEQFVRIFRDLIRDHAKMKTFIEFDFSNDVINITPQEFTNYTGKYKTINETIRKNKEKNKTSILMNIDFCIELIQNDKVNTKYILDILKSEFNEEEIKREKIQAAIDKLLDETTDEALKSKSQLIREFIKSYNPADQNESFEYDFNQFTIEYQKKEIYLKSLEYGIDENIIQELIVEYNYSGKINTDIKENISQSKVEEYQKTNNIKLKAKARKEMTEKLEEYIRISKIKYN